MGITKLNGFSGEAEVFGHLVQVKWAQEYGLQIVGLSLEDAYAILDKASTGKVEAVRVKAPIETNGPAVTNNVITAPVVTQPDPPTALDAAKTADAPPTEKKGKAKKEAPAEPLKEEPKSETKPADTKPPETAATEQPKETKQEQPGNVVQMKPATGGTGENLASKLQNSTKLKDVLGVLMETGLSGVDALTAKCEELKASVPLLSRIANMRDRVQRTLEVMDTGAAAS